MDSDWFTAPATAPRALFRATIPTPLGDLLAVAGDDGLHLIDWHDRKGLPGELARLARRTGLDAAAGRHPVLDQAAREMAEYFDGRRGSFTLPLSGHGTAFQRAVWAALVAIPAGQTRAYAGLADQLGQGSARAVARANGDNYRGIVVPCHRLVGSDGALTGYGGGLARKRWLLDHEKRMAA